MPRKKKDVDSGEPLTASEDIPKSKTTRAKKKKQPDSGEPLSSSEEVKTEQPLPDSGEPLPPTPEPLAPTMEPLTASDQDSGGELMISGETISHADWGVFVGELWELHKSGRIRQMLDGTKIVEDSGKPLMPEIKPESKSPTSISVNKKLMKMALEKAKKDRDNPSGQTLQISGLVQWLVWRYIGCPETWPPAESEDA